MGSQLLIELITTIALINGIEPVTALSIAKIESNYNVNAIGGHGEVGVFQILPQYSMYSKKQLKDPVININEGIRILKQAKQNCIHKENKTFVVCYNVGLAGAKKIKHPTKFPYYKKFVLTKELMIKEMIKRGYKPKSFTRTANNGDIQGN